ncbi:MAG: hypothetical protein QMC78_04550 [Methanocellales archaeon]|nr:hypothetical protein [Methanocellales archaeon]
MKDTLFTVIGVVVGILFGASAVTTLLSLLQGSVETFSALSSGATLIVSLVIAAVLIIKIRIISSLISGAIIGIVLNVMTEAFIGTDLVTLIISQLGL